MGWAPLDSARHCSGEHPDTDRHTSRIGAGAVQLHVGVHSADHLELNGRDWSGHELERDRHDR